MKKQEYIVLRIKNLTDEKLYNVSCLNHKYKDQYKIGYSSTMDIDYDATLRIIDNSVDKKIYLIRKVALCDYMKFASKQIECDIKLSTVELDGGTRCLTHKFEMDKSQFQCNIVDLLTDFSIKTGIDITLQFLMPETEVHLTIFLKDIAKNETINNK